MGRIITTGERKLRQRLGIQSGFISVDEAKRMRDESIEKADYYAKKEPGGIVMSKMQEQTHEMEKAEKALTASIAKFVESAKVSEKNIRQTSGKIRDSSDKLSAAIQKFMTLTNSSDFGKTVEQAESLVSSLERLAALECSGKLDRVMAAMRQR